MSIADIPLKQSNIHLTLHHCDLEGVIVPVVSNPVMNLGSSRHRLLGHLFPVIGRAAGASGARAGSLPLKIINSWLSYDAWTCLGSDVTEC